MYNSNITTKMIPRGLYEKFKQSKFNSVFTVQRSGTFFLQKAKLINILEFNKIHFYFLSFVLYFS